MIDKKQVKKIVNQILKENKCIIVTSEGLTLIQGSKDHSINSIYWMLKQLYENERDAFDEIMKDVDKLRKKKEPKI